jgi:hypothetical protein
VRSVEQQLMTASSERAADERAADDLAVERERAADELAAAIDARRGKGRTQGVRGADSHTVAQT